MCGENHVPTVAPVAAKTPTSNAKAFGDNGRHMRTPSPMAMPLAIPVATQGRNACGENKLNNNMTTMTARKALTNALLEATRIRTPISLYLTPELSRPTKRCRLERIVRVVDTTPDKVENQRAYQTMQRELHDALCITKPSIDGRNAVDEKFY